MRGAGQRDFVCEAVHEFGNVENILEELWCEKIGAQCIAPLQKLATQSFWGVGGRVQLAKKEGGASPTPTSEK